MATTFLHITTPPETVRIFLTQQIDDNLNIQQGGGFDKNDVVFQTICPLNPLSKNHPTLELPISWELSS
jgi:hypothetical protein